MKRFVILALAILALAALVVGVIGFVFRGSPTATVALSSSTVHAGDVVTVTGSNVPANQAGEIHLLSVLHTFPFTADRNGNVNVEITVPVDTDVGDHTVSICWAGGCHGQTTLVVTAPLSLPSPSPSPTPIAIRPVITLSASTVRIGGPLTIAGRNFDPARRATVVIYVGSQPHTLVGAPVGVASDGTFVVRVKIPGSVSPGRGEIVACIYYGSPAPPTSSQCGAKPVQVVR